MSALEMGNAQKISDSHMCVMLELVSPPNATAIWPTASILLVEVGNFINFI